LHFAKEEEEIYQPLLDAGLAPVDADELFRAMHEHVRGSGSASHAQEHR
jgi:hypothetical protein